MSLVFVLWQGEQIYIYKTAAFYTLIEGYPKSIKEELGIEGPVDAAFVCNGSIVHVIQGMDVYGLNLILLNIWQIISS